MEFTIRTANTDDAPSIARVQLASWQTTYSGIVPDAYLQSMDVEFRSARWEEQLSAASSATFVAENRAGVFGFVSGGALREPIAGYDGELYAIYLVAEHQGQGIGRLLAANLAASLRDLGFQRMVVWVLDKNPAVGFYARLGGVLIAQKMIEIGGASLLELAFGIGLDQVLPPPTA